MKDRNTNTMLECYYNSRIVSYLVLHDKFGFGQKRIVNLEKAVDKYLDDYSEGVYKTGFFEEELVKRGVDLRRFVNKIPSRVKMMLTYGSRIPKKLGPKDMTIIQSSVYTFFAITLYAMNRDMKISIKKINETYMQWMMFNFECLAEKNRLRIEDIVRTMIEECGYLDPRFAIQKEPGEEGLTVAG